MEVTVIEVEGVTVLRARLTSEDPAGQVEAVAAALPADVGVPGAGATAPGAGPLVVDLGPSPEVEGLAGLLADVERTRMDAGREFAVVSARDAVREALRAAGVRGVVESLDAATGDLAPASLPRSPAEHDAPPHFGLDARGD